MSASSPPPLPMRWDPSTCDVYLMRTPHIRTDDPDEWIGVYTRTNVPDELRLWPDIGQGWGPDRREGVTLAANILHAILRPGPDEVCDCWHVPLSTSPWVGRLAYMLYLDLLEGVPYWGGRLAGHILREWLAANQREWAWPGLDLTCLTAAEAFPRWPWR